MTGRMNVNEKRQEWALFNQDVAPLPLGGSLAVWLDWNGDLILLPAARRWPPPFYRQPQTQTHTQPEQQLSFSILCHAKRSLAFPPPPAVAATRRPANSLMNFFAHRFPIKYSTPFSPSFFSPFVLKKNIVSICF